MVLGPLLISFVLIFLAELGDKTLYAVMLLAARHRSLPVLIGSWLAFALQGVIATALGSLIARLPQSYVKWGAAVVFLIVGLVLLLKPEQARSEAPDRPSRSAAVILKSFGLVFAAEWGDATQVGTAALVARFNAPLSVFAGATLGLWAGAALAVLIGRALGARLPTRLLRMVAGLLFCVFAVATAARA